MCSNYRARSIVDPNEIRGHNEMMGNQGNVAVLCVRRMTCRHVVQPRVLVPKKGSARNEKSIIYMHTWPKQILRRWFDEIVRFLGSPPHEQDNACY